MKKIFEPLKIRNLEIKNRICVPPMVTRFSEPDTGIVEDGTVEHYRTIAKGMPGLIIQEATCVNMDGRLMNLQLGIWNDHHVEGLRRVVEAVHEEGSAIFIQLHHAGVVGISKEPLCPSNYSYTGQDGTIKTGREMTIEEIKVIQNDFIQAGIRAFDAGYDGIELHGCHQYLMSQFLNKKVNKRTDSYGENPEKFVVEIVEKIREKTSPNFVIGIRLGGFEPTIEDAIHNAQMLEQGGIDFIDISYGFTMEQEVLVPDDYPFIDIIYAAEMIKAAVNIPVFAANKITSPEMAEDILVRTKADMIDIGRGFIVNPNWMKDAIEGNDTGKCLHCKSCQLYEDPDKCPGKILFQRNREKNI
jgi:2,4-dienoyl-CoA reductase-like NADH-dependent reductase (Old Yellow Enzyme family)